MTGNTFGKIFTITSFGESHGSAMGVVIDGLPSKLPVSLENLQKELDRRAPGKSGTSSRQEKDQAEILSGVFENQTLGTPVAVIVRNQDMRSEDYEWAKNELRPGHADATTVLKYGIRDHRGGGRSSGRETLARVIGGYFASLIIPEVQVQSSIAQLGPFSGASLDYQSIKIQQFLQQCQIAGESVGGKIHIEVTHCPAGLGEPCFDKLKGDFAKALLSIPAAVSFSYGLGEEFSFKKGSEVTTEIKNFGGMEGGISNGEPLHMDVIFRPPSTVGKKAQEGRHDPCILPRVLPVVEAMIKIVLADHFLRQKIYSL